MCALRWDVQPSPDQSSCVVIPIFRVGKSAKAFVWLLAPFEGLWTHFVRKKTLPCVDQGCPYCETFPAKWKGYAPCLVWVYNDKLRKSCWEPRVVEITERVRELQGKKDLVGKVIEIRRQGIKPNGPLVWELAGDRQQPQGSPPIQAFDIEPSLEALFDLPGRHLRPTSQPTAAVEEDAPTPPPSRLPCLNGHANGKGGAH